MHEFMALTVVVSIKSRYIESTMEIDHGFVSRRLCAPSSLLLDRLKTLAARAGQGHAYIIGETSGVRAQRQFLLAQGWRREQITAEGYWRPGRVGGHDHV